MAERPWKFESSRPHQTVRHTPDVTVPNGQMPRNTRESAVFLVLRDTAGARCVSRQDMAGRDFVQSLWSAFPGPHSRSLTSRQKQGRRLTPNFHRRDAGSVKPESDLLLIPPQREVDGHQGFRTDVCWLRSLDDTRTDTGALTFSYNGQDDRVAKTSSTGTRRFVYDGDGRVLGEYGVSATDVKAEFIWAQPQVANDNTPFGGDDGAGGYDFKNG